MTLVVNYRYDDENKTNLRGLYVLLANSLREQRDLPKEIHDYEHFKQHAQRTLENMPESDHTAKAQALLRDGVEKTIAQLDQDLSAAKDQLEHAKQDYEKILVKLDRLGESWFDRSLTVSSSPFGPYVDGVNILTDKLKEDLTEDLSAVLPESSFELISYRDEGEVAKIDRNYSVSSEYEIAYSSVNEDKVIQALGRLVSRAIEASTDIVESKKHKISVNGEDRTVTTADGVKITRALGFQVDGERDTLTYYLGKDGNVQHCKDRGMKTLGHMQAPFLKYENGLRDEVLDRFMKDPFGGSLGKDKDGYQKAMVRFAILYLDDHGSEFNIDKLKQSLRKEGVERTNTLEN